MKGTLWSFNYLEDRYPICVCLLISTLQPFFLVKWMTLDSRLVLWMWMSHHSAPHRKLIEPNESRRRRRRRSRERLNLPRFLPLSFYSPVFHIRPIRRFIHLMFKEPYVWQEHSSKEDSKMLNVTNTLVYSFICPLVKKRKV